MSQRRSFPHIPSMVCILALLATACSGNRAPGADAEPVPGSGPVILGGEQAKSTGAPPEEDGRSTAARFNIPPGHLPPPGQCRVWMPGEPPGQQKQYPVGRCSSLRTSIPAGAWLVYRPTDDRKHVRVWKYDEDRQVLFQRIYDVATGELVRHVAPAGG